MRIFGAPFEGTDKVVAQRIRNAVDNGASVINMSLGSPGRDNTFGYGLVNPRNTLRGLGLVR